jgi:quercetin dioxygenase-like cupin family protein
MKYGKWLTALSALLALNGTAAKAQDAAGEALAHARIFDADAVPPRKLANGGESRDLVAGTLATGEAVTIHQSVQPAGAPPNPAHRIDHSEFILVQEGTLEYEHDGKIERAGPGDVIYVAFGTMHRVRNAGGTAARYTVISIGGDVKK